MTETRRLVINRDGLLVDPVTGVVVDDHPIDYGPEWRSFSEEDRLRRSRVGAPLTERLHDHGLTTYVDDPWLARTQISVSRRGQHWLIRLLRMLNKECREIGARSIVCEDAAHAARVLAEKLPNTKRELVVKAALLWAQLRHGEHVHIPRRLLRILRKAGLSIRLDTDTVVYKRITEIVAGLGLAPIIAHTAMKIYRVYLAEASGLATSRAAAAVYLAAKLHDKCVTQDTVAEQAKLSSQAIRNVLRSTRNKLRIHYIVDGIVVEEWRYGKNMYGAYQPSEIASMYGITDYTFSINIPASSNKPIQVEIKAKHHD